MLWRREYYSDRKSVRVCTINRGVSRDFGRFELDLRLKSQRTMVFNQTFDNITGIDRSDDDNMTAASRFMSERRANRSRKNLRRRYFKNI